MASTLVNISEDVTKYILGTKLAYLCNIIHLGELLNFNL